MKAVKEGYVIKPTSGNNFEAFKLASVTCNILAEDGISFLGNNYLFQISKNGN